MANPRTAERRQSRRVQLRVPIALTRARDNFQIETTTENLTSRGFYCLSEEPFTPGERLECRLTVPCDRPTHAGEPVFLLCRARIVRVERTPQGRYGLGCEIEDYAVAGREEAL